MIRLGGLDLGAHHAQQPRPQVGFLGEYRLGGGDVVVEGEGIEALDQVLFGAEVVVDVAGGDAGLLGDEAHRGLFVAALAEEIEGSAEDLCAGLLALGRPARLRYVGRHGCLSCTGHGARRLPCVAQKVERRSVKSLVMFNIRGS